MSQLDIYSFPFHASQIAWKLEQNPEHLLLTHIYPANYHVLVKL
jgi:hypothetical protein